MTASLPPPDAITLEYARLVDLIDGAARGDDLMQHIAYGTLFVDPPSGLVVEVNAAAAALLGTNAEDLLNAPIAALELHREEVHSSTTPRHPTIEAQLYSALYRHGSGQPLPVTVQRQRVEHAGQIRMMYRLIDRSLHGRLWYELRRREDDGFHFQQKLADINNLAVDLSHIASFDLLCRQAVSFGLERLGFDRLSLWLVDEASGQMRGTYGIDESGSLRDERGQSWFYSGTLVSGFINGTLDKPFLYSESPLYNDRSEVVGYGWHLTVPLLHDRRCLGILSADNFRDKLPIRNYQPELLRLYGMTLAHILTQHEARQQAIALRLAHERAGMLEEFIRSIAHDFRTPLANIQTYAYLLRRASEPERAAKSARVIEEQVTLISRTIARMMELIRLQHDAPLIRAAVPVTAIVEAAILPFQERIDSQAIVLSSTGSAATRVAADAEALTRALSEIIDNALHVSPPGGMLAVRWAEGEDGGTVALAVQDNGPGMDESTLARIFEPLYRGDSARTDRRSGFGLAIARAIVTAHDGTITVSSAPGEGTTCTLIIPAYADPPVQAGAS